MLNSQRETSTPTRAISPATTAVATPPDHNIRASTWGRTRCGGGYADRSGGYGRLSGLLGSIGTVMVLGPPRGWPRLPQPIVLSSPLDRVPNTGTRGRGVPGLAG